MKRSILTLCALSFGLCASVQASFLSSYATVNGTFYDLNAATANADFQGADLGTFNTGDSVLLGAEMNITGGNVEYSRIGWGIYDSGDNLIGSFTETAGSFDSVQSGNDRWTVVGGARPNIISGLTAGDYTVEVYLHGKYNGGGNFFENNSSNNYVAGFTIVPEPGTYALLIGAVALGLVAIRRRLR